MRRPKDGGGDEEAVAPIWKAQGERMTQARNRLRLSYDDIARELKVDDDSVRKWLAGTSIPRGDRLQALADLLRVPVEWITKGTLPLNDVERGREVVRMVLERTLQGEAWPDAYVNVTGRRDYVTPDEGERYPVTAEDLTEILAEQFPNDWRQKSPAEQARLLELIAASPEPPGRTES